MSPEGGWPSRSAGVAAPLLSRASSFVVTLTAGEGCTRHEHCDDWRDARDTYLEPPRGYSVVGISACDKDGVPYARLDAWDMAQLRKG